MIGVSFHKLIYLVLCLLKWLCVGVDHVSIDDLSYPRVNANLEAEQKHINRFTLPLSEKKTVLHLLNQNQQRKPQAIEKSKSGQKRIKSRYSTIWSHRIMRLIIIIDTKKWTTYTQGRSEASRHFQYSTNIKSQTNRRKLRQTMKTKKLNFSFESWKEFILPTFKLYTILWHVLILFWIRLHWINMPSKTNEW